MWQRTSFLIGAYTTEKGGINISYNEPLIFVQGPPVYVKVAVFEEESTSVFVPNDESVRETIDNNRSVQAASHVVNPAIMSKIRYLSRPFQKQVYKPLQFIVEGDRVKGEIQKYDEGSLWVVADDMITQIEIAKIEDVLWRGQPFDTRT